MNTPTLPFLRLLAQQFPTLEAASTELIHLRAILELPKITEHFMSDIHGENEAFQHVLRNGAGAVRLNVEKVFGYELSTQGKRSLATLIYYPEQKMEQMVRQVPDPAEWYRVIILRLLRLVRLISADFTQAYVRKRLPTDFAYLIETLLYKHASPTELYAQAILDSVIEFDMARKFIVALANLIKALTVGHFHIIGDVYDRGPGAHLILDALTQLEAVDFQWGNHDIVWMGAAAGSEACIANVIRFSLRYANMETLENGYAISMFPLASFAMETYGEDPCATFQIKENAANFSENEKRLMAKMHKAITIIQLKLEGQAIQRNPEFAMSDRNLLDKIDHASGTVSVGGQTYPLRDTGFPTVDPADPYTLTPGEREVMERLKSSFANSEKLQKHVRFWFSKGSMYLIHDNHLLYHGCIPMNSDGSFRTFVVGEQEVGPKEFMDHVEHFVRKGYFSTEQTAEKQRGLDMFWYLWSGADSPLFGKEKMATFERYFLKDSAIHKEPKDPYYTFRDRPETARRILEAFGLDPDHAHIVNGHVPVQVKKGESPVKAGGRLLVIDGGFAKAYQDETGIAGYTLIDNPDALILVAHSPFVSTQKAIEDEIDIASDPHILETYPHRLRVRDTDLGQSIQQRIEDLKQLLQAYRAGVIKEM